MMSQVASTDRNRNKLARHETCFLSSRVDPRNYDDTL